VIVVVIEIVIEKDCEHGKADYDDDNDDDYDDAVSMRPILDIGTRTLDLSKQAIVVGIVNVTPDSFSDGGKNFDTGTAIESGRRMAAEGAGILDVGGESTRPGAGVVPVEEELRRVLPVVKALAEGTGAVISIDTRKAAVAEAAIAAGARIVNDVSGLRFDPRLAGAAAGAGAGLVLMHMRGTPEDMQRRCQYRDVAREVCEELRDSMRTAREAGVREEQLAVDPGFGFAKTLEQNLELLRRLSELQCLGRPIMVGTSRKSMIRRTLGEDQTALLMGTAATLVMALERGARLLRVHDVREAALVARMWGAVNE
jgi:dihydropteroate synthase